MGQTLRIEDDETGASASVRIEIDRQGNKRIAQIVFEEVDGRGLSAKALRLLEPLGISMPESAAPAVADKRPARPAKPAAKPPAAAKKTRPRPTPPPAAPAPANGNGGLPDSLRNPAPAPVAAAPSSPALPAAPTFTEPADVPEQRPAPAAFTTGKRAYHGSGRPSADDLRAVFYRHNGVNTEVARELNVHPTTVGAWLKHYREHGERFTMADAPVGAQR